MFLPPNLIEIKQGVLKTIKKNKEFKVVICTNEDGT